MHTAPDTGRKIESSRVVYAWRKIRTTWTRGKAGGRVSAWAIRKIAR